MDLEGDEAVLGQEQGLIRQGTRREGGTTEVSLKLGPGDVDDEPGGSDGMASEAVRGWLAYDSRGLGRTLAAMLEEWPIL